MCGETEKRDWNKTKNQVSFTFECNLVCIALQTCIMTNPPPSSLSQFISLCRSRLPYTKRVILVCGNEACDLDSMISSLVYSHFKSHIDPDPSVLYAPFWQVERVDISLRPEAVWLFDILELKDVIEKVFCLDDIEMLENLDVIRQVILCDHNRATVFLDADVVEVIDHHADTKTHLYTSKYIVREVGSCCTLIAQELLSSEVGRNVLFKKDKLGDWGEDFSHSMLCLYSCILLDTSLLTLKTSELEFFVLEELNLRNSSLANILYEELIVRRSDVSSFTKRQLLRKDLKFGGTPSSKFAISSIPLPIDEFLNEDGFDAIIHICSQKQLDVFCIMAAFKSDSIFYRQLLIFFSDQYLQHVPNCLDRAKIWWAETNLKLEPFFPSLSDRYASLLVWKQGALESSRKQVLPLFEKFLQVHSKL